ncbi:ZDP [Symbiodinium natans]|uniref:ZDP protein n=1 Tax=Symbiodinium natans TaxID=878477 RepID=A0A812UP97_9DINO|nr:ZDP [Symbiodinium natans]
MQAAAFAGPRRALLRNQDGNHEALKLFTQVPARPPWYKEGWCLFRSEDAAEGARVAAFDFDKTLHHGGMAWRLSSAHIPGRLRQLHEEGYRIVIFSNQHGPGRQRTREAMQAEVRDITARFDDFASFCRVPLQIFVAAARGDVGDAFRKPNIGMWELLCSSRCSRGTLPDPALSFYVGNSAGRKTDGNDVDRQFAQRLGLKFYTEAFLTSRGA